MPYGLRSRRGLGTMVTWGGTLAYSLSELPAVCSSGWLKYAVTPQCWSYERSAWAQMSKLPPVPDLTVAPGAIPSGYGAGPATVEQANRETGEVLAEAWRQQHENYETWGAGLPDNPIPDVPCSYLNIPCWMLALGLGIGAFGVFAAVGGGRGYR